jgi:hypothetical protein
MSVALASVAAVIALLNRASASSSTWRGSRIGPRATVTWQNASPSSVYE